MHFNMNLNAFSFFLFSLFSFTLYYIELDYVPHTHAVHKISNEKDYLRFREVHFRWSEILMAAQHTRKYLL